MATPKRNRRTALNSTPPPKRVRKTGSLAKYAKKRGVQVRQMGLGIVLYDPDTEKAFLLNLTASVVWNYIGSGRNLESIVDAFELGFTERAIDRKAVRGDISWLIDQFITQGVLVLVPTTRRKKVVPIAVVNDYGMPEISAAYLRPTIKAYTLEELRQEFGKGGQQPRFSDTWNPEPQA